MTTPNIELPSAERRERLAAGMANLVRKQGYEPLLCFPLLEANERCFPDPFDLTAASVRRLIKRIMTYAGLGHLSVALQVEDSLHVDEQGNAVAIAEHLPPAWFSGTDGRVCRFGLDARLAEDSEQLVAVLCHEVAHAFRAVHGLVVSTSDIEEALTDLTTVYLGFGVLTTNATWQYRTGGETHGSYVVSRRKLARSGYLDPGEMSFLLALQSIARGHTAAEVRRLQAKLEPNQAQLFADARELLTEQEPNLVAQLDLPPPSQRVSPISVDQACIDLSDDDDLATEASEPPLLKQIVPAPAVRKGEKVYRIGRNGMIIGLVVGGGLGLTFCVMSPVPYSLLVILAFAAGGGLFGRSIRWFECAAPGCDGKTSADDTQCPACQGQIAGVVRDRYEGMSRQEEDEAAQKKTSVRRSQE